MAVTGTTDLGNGLYATTVDHDPTTTATNALTGSLIIAVATTGTAVAGNWYRKLDDGSTTNVQLMSPSQAVLQWGATTTGSTAQRFLNHWGALGGVLNAESLQSQILIPGPAGATRILKNARVILTTAPGGILTNVFTVRVNGVATSIVVTVTGAATTGSDLVHSASVSPGDRVSVAEVDAGANAGIHIFSLDLE